MTSQNTIRNAPLVAMVHYHLRRGGVTRVIQHAIQALSAHDYECVVVAGEPPPEGVDQSAPIVVVDGLSYHESGNAPSADELLQQVRDAIRDQCRRDPDLWHIHNHALGKNAAWTQAVHSMANQHIPLLLHIHDFAEDGRPRNYNYLRQAIESEPDSGLESILYPQSDFTHYAVLNQRDQQILQTAGMPSAHVHLLPNAVATESCSEIAPPSQEEPPSILYPTRAIRRKNIGEFLFWATLDDGDRTFGITLAPESPGEIPPYKHWQAVASELQLPVEFEMGLNNPFSELIQRATALATTSIAEGFGLAFLEPWLANRPLAGRCLPEITAEFEAAGIELDGLYSELTVPADWIDTTGFRQRLQATFRDTRLAYGQPVQPADEEQAWQQGKRDQCVELGHLDEIAQEEIIRHIRKNKVNRADLVPSDWLANLADPQQTLRNQQRVQQRYSLDGYGQKLADLYDSLLSASSDDRRPHLPPGAVLNQFLSPDRFRMLRA